MLVFQTLVEFFFNIIVITRLYVPTYKVKLQGVFEVEAFLLTCDSMRGSKEF
jgi:hypothetical protein